MLFESGSIISIPPEAFNGCSNENITIQYRELSNKQAMLRSGVPMTYNEGILESGGMFEIYALCDGNKIDLASKKEITVKFASSKRLDGLDAFHFNKCPFRCMNEIQMYGDNWTILGHR